MIIDKINLHALHIYPISCSISTEGTFILQSDTNGERTKVPEKCQLQEQL